MVQTSILTGAFLASLLQHQDTCGSRLRGICDIVVLANRLHVRFASQSDRIAAGQ